MFLSKKKHFCPSGLVKLVEGLSWDLLNLHPLAHHVRWGHPVHVTSHHARSHILADHVGGHDPAHGGTKVGWRLRKQMRYSETNVKA